MRLSFDRPQYTLLVASQMAKSKYKLESLVFGLQNVKPCCKRIKC